MIYTELKKLEKKHYFTVEDVSALFGITMASAKVLCTRYAKRGIFIRLKNNFYVLDRVWETSDTGDFLRIANFLQVPSYISFMTALSVYEVTTQVQRGFFESASLKRSKKVTARGVVFNYYKLKKAYYFDFTKESGLFVASKEKAFLDAVYLYSFGKYRVDFSSLDLDKLDKNRIKKIMVVFPDRTRRAIKRLCSI